MNRNSIRSHRHSFLLIFAFACLCTIFLTACTEKEKLPLDIPEGFATTTLKDFARQTNVEILFDRQSVYGVKTNAVKGKYDPGSALGIMLKDTPLGV
ncbi:MAG: STN domain-containing protein, partial [Verrucomicrobia bacterium]|nr:STN domain-containing protein [Verrucomicrobiota bacterium]